MPVLEEYNLIRRWQCSDGVMIASGVHSIASAYRKLGKGFPMPVHENAKQRIEQEGHTVSHNIVFLFLSFYGC